VREYSPVVAYTIADEPHDTAWKQLVVSPTGPMLAEIVCGSWLSLPWFVVNAIALGSPTKRKEIALCVLQLIVTIALGSLLIWLDDRDLIESRTLMQLSVLAIVAWKVWIAYAITRIQSRVYQVYELYGGPARATTFVIAAGILVRPFVQGLSDDPLWWIIVMGNGFGP
jgi:hypothetical protein